MNDNLPSTESFHGLIRQLRDAEGPLADPDFDPAKLVGKIRDKVDGIKFVLDKMEGTILGLKAFVAPILTAIETIENNKQRLEAYVLHSMEAEHETVLPGHTYKVRIAFNPPHVEIRKPMPEDFATYYGYVKQKISYQWDKKRIKSDILSGVLGDSFPGILVRQSKPEFKPNLPIDLEKKPRQKKVGHEQRAIPSTSANERRTDSSE